MTIVLSVHGLGAAWLGGYGNEWIATPNLDRLAATGTVYDHHFASGKAFTPLEGFAHLREAREDRPLRNLRKFVVNTPGDKHLESDAFMEPWFAPAELMADYGDDELARYAAAVVYFDAEFGALVEQAPHARWVVTGISGHALGSEQPVHLPLIIGDGAGRRIAALTADRDLPAILRGETVSRDKVISPGAIRTAEWTLITGEEPRLYLRPQDRFEVNDVSRLYPDVVERLMADLQ